MHLPSLACRLLCEVVYLSLAAGLAEDLQTAHHLTGRLRSHMLQDSMLGLLSSLPIRQALVRPASTVPAHRVMNIGYFLMPTDKYARRTAQGQDNAAKPRLAGVQMSLVSLLDSVPCGVLYIGLLERSLVSVLNAAVKFAYAECNIISDLCEADMEVPNRQHGITQHSFSIQCHGYKRAGALCALLTQSVHLARG